MSSYADIQNMVLASLQAAGSPYSTIPPDFATLFAQATQYAEQRIAQEIPLLGNRKTDSTSIATTAGSNMLTLGSLAVQPVVVVEGIALITPAHATVFPNGTLIEFEKVSLDFLELVWPKPGSTMNPASALWVGTYWAEQQDGTSPLIRIAPTPDNIYNVFVTYLAGPTPLNNGAPTNATYLSTSYPSLYEAACLVWMAGAYKRNFGAAADDPRSAASWEQQYQTLKAAAEFEERRRRGLLPNEPMPPPAPMTPQRR